ncbi:MAG TPA: GGDEF domain-containing protein [Pyrinomonadaceae bacterium]|nr:GGDEF domain-containing protein [Pyrinomonadaceae bacterium]HMP64252.1 GGDEF domain-containing protein [Pyrinomonadaceae bacterium]
MDSKTGLLIQLNGVFLITILSVFLRRSLHLTALKYWTVAWLCLSFALISLRLAFDLEEYRTLLFTYYFLGEYIFGFMLIAGCRSLDTDFELRTKQELWVVPFILLAIGLPLVTIEFHDLFPIHSLVLAGIFATSFVMLGRSENRSIGRHVIRISLALLTVNYGGYFALASFGSAFPFAVEIMGYNSIVNLVLQTSLGFGMVIVLLEKLLFESETSRLELAESNKQLETLVHTDPLTEALNRHAFYGFVRKGSERDTSIGGCVGFFDIDGLKDINDCFGHAVGDAAIRFVVGSIRKIIRAEDLIFRWGGDEFFVIMISMGADLAELRMSRLEQKLREVPLNGMSEPIDIGVSWGFTDFAGIDELEKAIAAADAEMYRRKRERKASFGEMQLAVQQAYDTSSRSVTR